MLLFISKSREKHVFPSQASKKKNGNFTVFSLLIFLNTTFLIMNLFYCTCPKFKFKMTIITLKLVVLPL